MEIARLTALPATLKEQVLELWNREYPSTLCHTPTGFDDYLNNLTDQKHYSLTGEYGALLGWAFTFPRDGGRWFAIIIDGASHGKGYGTKLLHELKRDEPLLYGWVMDHDTAIKSDSEPYKSPLGFYIKNGFSVHAGTRLETPKLSAVKISWSAG